MKHIITVCAALALGLSTRADTTQLSDFSNFTPGAYFYTDSGRWSADTARSDTTTFSIGNFGSDTPRAANGNGFYQWLGDTPQDWSQLGYVNLTGVALASNAATTINFYIEDNNFQTSLTAFTLADFASGLSTVSKQIDFGGIALDDISYWGFQVSDFSDPAPAFGFTFDNVSVSTSAIPEPSTYAALFGGAVGVFVLLRRRFAKAPRV